jgi:hypothetical protein
MSKEQLIRRIKDRREYRDRDNSRFKAAREYQREIDDAPERTMHEFWCDTCQRDYSAVGYKQARGGIAWYVGFCPCGKENIRRITHKGSDPYYHKSQVVRHQRIDMADDFVQPSDPRFKELYPKMWAKLNGQ